VAQAAGITPRGFDGFDPLAMRPRTEAEVTEARAVLDRFTAYCRGLVKVRSGPWRDLAVRKRPTEVDHMVGWVIAEGRARGVAMPLNERLVAQVKEIERGARQRGLHNLDELERSDRNGTDAESGRDRRTSDEQRGPRPVHDSRQHVAPRVVGAEREASARRLEAPADALPRVGTVDDRPDDGNADNEGEEREAERGRGVEPEPASDAPRAALANGLACRAHWKRILGSRTA